MGKDGTQLLRQCVRILVLVSTDLLAVRLSGISFCSAVVCYCSFELLCISFFFLSSFLSSLSLSLSF